MFEEIDPVFNVTFFSLITSNTSAVCSKRIETSSKPHVEFFYWLVRWFLFLSFLVLLFWTLDVYLNWYQLGGLEKQTAKTKLFVFEKIRESRLEIASFNRALIWSWNGLKRVMVLTKTWRFFFPSFDTYLKRQHVKNLLPRMVEKKFFCITYHQTKSDSNVNLSR